MRRSDISAADIEFVVGKVPSCRLSNLHKKKLYLRLSRLLIDYDMYALPRGEPSTRNINRRLGPVLTAIKQLANLDTAVAQGDPDARGLAKVLANAGQTWARKKLDGPEPSPGLLPSDEVLPIRNSRGGLVRVLSSEGRNPPAPSEQYLDVGSDITINKLLGLASLVHQWESEVVVGSNSPPRYPEHEGPEEWLIGTALPQLFRRMFPFSKGGISRSMDRHSGETLLKGELLDFVEAALAAMKIRRPKDGEWSRETIVRYISRARTKTAQA